MHRKTLILGSVLAASLLITVIVSYAALTYRITGRGTIYVPPTVKIGIYSDKNCTRILTEINWGTLNPGSTARYPAYIRNEGDVPVSLAMSTNNWNPPQARQYMALTWNYTGSSILVKKVVPIEFQLKVFSNVTGFTDFSFEIVISAEG